MALPIYLTQNSSATRPDSLSIKAEAIGYNISRNPITFSLPSAQLLGLDLGRFTQDIRITAVIDEDLEEVFIANASGTFTVGETITGTAAWDAGVTPARSYGSVLGCIVVDTPILTDETVDANDAGANDVPLLPAAPIENDGIYLGSIAPCNLFRLNIGTAGVKAPGAWGINYQYSRGGSSWGTLSGVTDSTTQFTVAGTNNISFTLPSDWCPTSVRGFTAYWIRLLADATTANPIGVQPLATQIWTAQTPTARVVSQTADKLNVNQFGHGVNDFFVDGETITGMTSGVIATVTKPLATFRRWEQVATNFYASGNMTLVTPNASYTVVFKGMTTERIAGKIGKLETILTFSRVAV